MKPIKLLLSLLIASVVLTSCFEDNNHDIEEPYYTLEDVVTEYEIWYVNIHKSSAASDVPFVANAFTLSFINGRLYANNNLVGFGTSGSDYGIQIGTYNTNTGYLRVNHLNDGSYEFEVTELSNGDIELYNSYNDASYVLEGYSTSTLNWDKIFYENIEYFLQEYDVWAKTGTSIEGELNTFDDENFLSFTPEDVTSFYSSQSKVGTTIANIFWNYNGSYSVADYSNEAFLKELTLYYSDGDTEVFELFIDTDQEIELYHINSETTYYFEGLGFIQYKKKTSTVQKLRKRTKVKRVQKVRTQRHIN
ncbi:MAG: hypothetical protein COB81_10390 [Flavobacteriaceae bacterium]|nr:MAG: hypothetical protein COB81_10390 [Flavobacteriaceae bacterium]